MRIARLFVCAALVAAFSALLPAQQAPAGYYRVACMKVKPENNTEFRKWAAGDVHKLAQSRIDSGVYSNWMLLRAVIPSGESAQCDYLVVSMYPGIPQHPIELDEFEIDLKKAGIAMSAQQYVDRRNSLTTLISNNLFQNQAFVGGYKKGDYFVVNNMKAQNVDDYVAFEKKAWKPFAESLAKQGIRSGWSLNTLVFPGGADVKFNAATVDIFPTWDSIFADVNFYEQWRKVHPDMEVGTTFEQYEKLRRQGEVDIYVLQDAIAPAK